MMLKFDKRVKNWMNMEVTFKNVQWTKVHHYFLIANMILAISYFVNQTVVTFIFITITIVANIYQAYIGFIFAP